jgi:hypothetical protein
MLAILVQTFAPPRLRKSNSKAYQNSGLPSSHARKRLGSRCTPQKRHECARIPAMLVSQKCALARVFRFLRCVIGGMYAMVMRCKIVVQIKFEETKISSARVSMARPNPYPHLYNSMRDILDLALVRNITSEQ